MGVFIHPLIAALLRDPDYLVREAALRAFGQLAERGDVEAIAAVEDLLASHVYLWTHWIPLDVII